MGNLLSHSSDPLKILLYGLKTYWRRRKYLICFLIDLLCSLVPGKKTEEINIISIFYQKFSSHFFLSLLSYKLYSCLTGQLKERFIFRNISSSRSFCRYKHFRHSNQLLVIFFKVFGSLNIWICNSFCPLLFICLCSFHKLTCISSNKILFHLS